jgi:hypothetical protein
MSWKRIALEVVCGFPVAPDKESPPAFCAYGPHHPEAHCIAGAESTPESPGPQEWVPCPFALWKRAYSTILVTDHLGENIAADEFWTDDRVTNAEWNDRQADWVEKRSDMIMRSRTDG